MLVTEVLLAVILSLSEGSIMANRLLSAHVYIVENILGNKVITASNKDEAIQRFVHKLGFKSEEDMKEIIVALMGNTNNVAQKEASTFFDVTKLCPCESHRPAHVERPYDKAFRYIKLRQRCKHKIAAQKHKHHHHHST